MVERAKPGKQKRVVGPHIVVPEHKPVQLHDSIAGIHEEIEYQWVCQYCGESEAYIEAFARLSSDCGDIEWIESEREALKV